MVPESPAGRGTMRRPLLWDRQGSSPAFVLRVFLAVAGFLVWPSLLCREMETWLVEESGGARARGVFDRQGS